MLYRMAAIAQAKINTEHSGPLVHLGVLCF